MFTIPLIFLFRHIAFCSASPLQLRQAVTPPPECNVIPTWEVTQFRWFNSSQNLDCVHQVNVPLVCVNSTSNGLVGCDGNIDHCASCGIPGCYTGLPLQPAGYGPPDDVYFSINVSGYERCEESNPQSIRRWDVGNGPVICAGVAYHPTFIGDSNPHADSSPNKGTIYFEPISTWTCTNGSTIRGSGSVEFDMDCSYDSANNATCVFDGTDMHVIPLTAYTIT